MAWYVAPEDCRNVDEDPAYQYWGDGGYQSCRAEEGRVCIQSQGLIIRSILIVFGREHPHVDTPFPAIIDARFTRPWEVALFALCATADVPGASFFRRMVLGPMGIPVFIRSLDSLLSVKVDMDDVKWEDIGLTLRALAFVSEQAWVVQGMSSSSEGEGDKVEAIIKAIMGVFWYVIQLFIELSLFILFF